MGKSLIIDIWLGSEDVSDYQVFFIIVTQNYHFEPSYYPSNMISAVKQIPLGKA